MKKEDFFDEQILDMIHQSEQMNTGSKDAASKTEDKENGYKTEERSIDTGVRIQGKWIYFERQFFAADSVSMMVPNHFVEMTKEEAKIKYPSEYRPERIMTDDTGTINLMFQYMEGETDPETMAAFRNRVFGLMKYANPGIKEREIGETYADGHRIAYVEFTSQALGGKLYNLMFYISVNGKPLMGNFNCMTKDVKYWQPVAREMMQSLRIEKTDWER